MIVQISTHHALTVTTSGRQVIVPDRTSIKFVNSDNETIVWWSLRAGNSVYREIPGEEGYVIVTR